MNLRFSLPAVLFFHFRFLIKVKWSITLCKFNVYKIVSAFYTLQCAHHQKFSFYLSPCIWCCLLFHPLPTPSPMITSFYISVQFSRSVLSDSLQPYEPQTPGLPVHHQLPESTQTHVHQVNDAIQPSHPLLSPSPPALNLSQHQGHFQWVSSLHQVAKVLEFQLQHQSFQWTPRTDLL